MMSDNQYKLVQYCIETQQYFTIKIHNCYCLFHRNLVQHSNNHKLELELSPLIIKKIFDSKPLSAIDVKSSCHVDPSLYDMIIFADKSITYTRTQLSLENNKDKLTVKESVQKKKKQRKLPYYVDADIELLKCCGISQSDIDVFKNKLNDKKLDLFHLNKYDHIIEKIINHTDITTTLNCRLVSKKWKTLIDRSSSWNYVCLLKLNRQINRVLIYLQTIDIHELVKQSI